MQETVKTESNIDITIASVQANCGNASPGIEVFDTLMADMFQKSRAISVLNCQELDMNNAIAEFNLLKQSSPTYKDYELVASDLMVTRTKWTEIRCFFGYTGIASLALVDTRKVQDVKFTAHREVRRDPNPIMGLIYGTSANNKGASINTLTFNKRSDQTIEKPSFFQRIKNYFYPPVVETKLSLACVSSHLNSESASQRSKNLHDIKKALAIKATTVDELIAALNDGELYGSDLNTRNIFNSDTNTSSLAWQVRENGKLTPGIENLHQNPLGAVSYSSASTYKTHDAKGTTDRSEKRPGETRGGALDSASININKIPTEKYNPKMAAAGTLLYKESPLCIKERNNGLYPARDHKVIASNDETLSSNGSDFEKLQAYMMNHLVNCAPNLAREISQLENNSVNKNNLFQIHQRLLAPEGLLNRRVAAYDEFNSPPSTAKIPWFANATIQNVTAMTEINFKPLEDAFKSFQKSAPKDKATHQINERLYLKFQSAYVEMQTANLGGSDDEQNAAKNKFLEASKALMNQFDSSTIDLFKDLIINQLPTFQFTAAAPFNAPKNNFMASLKSKFKSNFIIKFFSKKAKAKDKAYKVFESAYIDLLASQQIGNQEQMQQSLNNLKDALKKIKLNLSEEEKTELDSQMLKLLEDRTPSTSSASAIKNLLNEADAAHQIQPVPAQSAKEQPVPPAQKSSSDTVPPTKTSEPPEKNYQGPSIKPP